MKKKIILFPTLILFFTPIFLSSCSQQQAEQSIVWGNYESYMADVVMEDLYSENNVNFEYYGNDSEAITNFKLNKMDLATVSSPVSYKIIQNDLAQKINWQKISNDIEFSSQSNWVPYNKVTSKNIFSDEVNSIMKNCYDLNQNNIYGEVEDNLFQYCVPYFFQDFVFVYRNDEEIHELSKLNNTGSWKEILDVIFNQQVLGNDIKIGCVDDPRILLSFSRLVETDTSVNIDENKTSIGDIEKQYSFLYDYFSKYHRNTMFFNTDSSILVNKVVNESLSGCFFYNGDAVFSLLGGDIGDENVNNLHIVRANKNLLALDLMVINKNTSGKKLDNLYDAISKITFTNYSYKDPEFENTLVYKNFDFITYTPVNLELIEMIKNDHYLPSEDPAKDSLAKEILLINLENPNDSQSLIEYPLNELGESNLFFGYIDFKQKL